MGGFQLVGAYNGIEIGIWLLENKVVPWVALFFGVLVPSFFLYLSGCCEGMKKKLWGFFGFLVGSFGSLFGSFGSLFGLLRFLVRLLLGFGYFYFARSQWDFF